MHQDACVWRLDYPDSEEYQGNRSTGISFEIPILVFLLVFFNERCISPTLALDHHAMRDCSNQAHRTFVGSA